MSSEFESEPRIPKVAILLCTYQGQQFLAEQLDSFAAQTHANWAVWASDDGSKDATLDIFERYKENWAAGRLSVLQGPARGFAANFLALTCKTDIRADYYAYSDQDDIWEADKLERAVQWLESVPAEIPALYCARTRLVAADNTELGLSPLFGQPPCFANALIQNIAGGNTMVFNGPARALLQEAGEQLPILLHDWWAYMVVTGCGGKVFYDAKPSLRYRQHDANLVGMNSGWGARLERMGKLWQGQYREWNDRSIASLHTLENRLTPENRTVLERFAKARDAGLIQRLINFKLSGVHRQTLAGNMGLLAAVIFGKM